MSEAPVIETENVHKIYRLGNLEVYALKGINVTLNKGQFVAVMGPSGSGKTTLLNLIGALDRPTSGKIFIDGRDMTRMSEGELTNLRRHRIGFIFQFYNLIPVLTAFENVELPMLIAGGRKRERQGRALKLLQMVGLSQRADFRPEELSGGEQQRVAIARAIANSPSVVLADEPTGDLDTKTGGDVMGALRTMAKKEGVTVVVVTHDPVVAEMTDRILLMRDGMMIGEKRMS
jgi:putative ABC transport system ATP-binding protein